MAAGLAATGWLALRRDRRVAFCAASTATVLVMDAWFDVCTSPAGQPFTLALIDMCIEVGEAAACLVLAWLVWRDTENNAKPRERLASSLTSSKSCRRYDEMVSIVRHIQKSSARTDGKRLFRAEPAGDYRGLVQRPTTVLRCSSGAICDGEEAAYEG